MALAEDRIPSDPRKREEYETAQRQLERTQADQAQATQAMQDELAKKQKMAAIDAKRDSARLAERRKAEAAYKSEQQRQRDEYLATPLSADEKVELERMEAMANAQGVGSPDPDMMRTLADLRVRDKVKVKKG
ncbi:MAG: hypothetical protein LLG01_00650 [Planctomycetaceae bacterium]|nr:hypothetical protein [Planctomycetaceae bacterium]